MLWGEKLDGARNSRLFFGVATLAKSAEV